jgi:hypothetical protein
MCIVILPLGGYQLQLRNISYHIVSYHIISYRIVSYHHIISYIISYHIISYHISYHVMSYHIVYHIISYHIVSYRIISYRISYHTISYFSLILLIRRPRVFLPISTKLQTLSEIKTHTDTEVHLSWRKSQIIIDRHTWGLDQVWLPYLVSTDVTWQQASSSTLNTTLFIVLMFTHRTRLNFCSSLDHL